ncbi:hypothetical protein [Endozoicomonas sp. SESOKO2]|uniref:hypothetical protein n=2 Tax=unclassified Endozoicomonas TaxID=2644528 RepID=UPI002148C5DC|nr:hypothetical protein [Endozoicomonas sp. SESOKO2]
MLLHLLTLSVACQAQALTERFVVDLEQNATSQNQGFSIKLERRALPVNSSDITDTNGSEKSASLPDDKRHRPDGYEVKTTTIESLPWQWSYTTHLLIAYELNLTTKETPLSSPYSWVLIELVVAVGWLLKSHWNPDFPLLSPAERQEATSMLTQGNQPFESITMMLGSGQQSQGQSSKSSVQDTAIAPLHPAGSFSSTLNTDYGGGNGDPQHHHHTLGLNCFVFPCHGICQFPQSSMSSELSEWLLNSYVSSYPNLPDDHCFSDIGHWDIEHSRQTSPFDVLVDLPAIQLQYDSDPLFPPQAYDIGSNPTTGGNSMGGNTLEGVASDRVASDRVSSDGVSSDGVSSDGVASDGVASDSVGFRVDRNTEAVEQTICDQIVIAEDGQLRPSDMICKSSVTLSARVRRTARDTRKRTCDVAVVTNDGRQRICGRVFKNAPALSCHKSRFHSGQKTCVAVVWEDGQQRPCGRVFKNAQTMWDHKSRDHSGPQTCMVTEMGEDGQPRPCGRVCKNSKTLSSHKSRAHSRKKICQVILIGEDGQPRPCGKVCLNTCALSDHKRASHSEQQTCYAPVIGEDGQQRPCGMVLRSAKTLASHKRNAHSGQRTCNVIMVDEDGQQRSCGKVLKHAQALSSHKSRYHTGQQTCNLKVLWKDGQHRLCGIVFKHAQALYHHKRKAHTYQQTCDEIVTGQDGQSRPCGAVCNNILSLMNHKRIHRKRKPVDQNNNRDLSP